MDGERAEQNVTDDRITLNRYQRDQFVTLRMQVLYQLDFVCAVKGCRIDSIHCGGVRRHFVTDVES